MPFAHVDAFAALFERPLRAFAQAGPRVDLAWSPGALDKDPVHEERGWSSPSALLAEGWPLSEAQQRAEPGWLFAELPVLPWIGHVPRHEAEGWLGIDGMERAVELLIEPEAGAPFYGMSWRAGLRLSPERWLVLSVALTGAPYQQPQPYAAVYLAAWAVAGQEEIAVMVLPHGEAYRLGYRRILGVSQADLDGALDDELRGSLAF